MNLIVAVDKNWAIGNKGKLLVSIPSDMKFFREETSGEGKVVILGRKTLETFPGGRPLPKRLNVILTKNPDFKVDGAVVVHSVEEALEAVKDYADSVWAAKRYEVVLQANRLKFTQNSLLAIELKRCHGEFAECAVNDLVWGIGIDIRDRNKFDKSKWRGQNLLGTILGQVREELQ